MTPQNGKLQNKSPQTSDEPASLNSAGLSYDHQNAFSLFRPYTVTNPASPNLKTSTDLYQKALMQNAHIYEKGQSQILNAILATKSNIYSPIQSNIVSSAKESEILGTII